MNEMFDEAELQGIAARIKEIGLATRRIERLAREGCQTAGGQHKQWYLEQILEALDNDLTYCREKWGWEPGIAP